MRDPTSFLKKEYQDLVDQSLDWRIAKLQGAGGAYIKP